MLEYVAGKHPENHMLWCKNKYYTFADALKFSTDFSKYISKQTAVLLICEKSPQAYFAIFATILTGATYIPVNNKWNLARIANIFEQVLPEFIACDPEWAKANKKWLLDNEFEHTRFESSTAGELCLFRRNSPMSCKLFNYRREKNITDLLYVMFTSGSTGSPKGVPVSRANVDHYLQAMQQVFKFGAAESWIQSVELNFDLSVHDMLLAWTTAGCIISIPAEQSPMGPRFVKKLGVQNWLSVPSSAARTLSLGLLKENTMPSLKRSFFCGEALPKEVALAWGKAAPNAPVFNIYGPTEATIAFSWHKFNPQQDKAAIVQIGKPLPGLSMRLSTHHEIELGGAQVFAGYLQENPKTISKPSKDSQGGFWYQTGDIGAIGQDGEFIFRGRLDWQVKIRGNRIEIGEIEQAVRKATGCGLVTVVPVTEIAPGSFDDLYVFIDTYIDEKDIKFELTTYLPPYMIPKYFSQLMEFPYNSNGKIDRNTLVKIADESILAKSNIHRNRK
ncbi:MAG: AMP-binding protein [Rhodobacteraceae bacterium]|nr:AMP-binding protein [Paracoccaceae bacterium]